MAEGRQRGKKEAEDPKIALSRAVLDHMYRLSRLYKLYNINNEVIRKQQIVFFDQVTRYFAEHEDMVMRITPNEILCSGKPIYDNANRQTSIAFKLFKDGVRKLRFLRGVTVEELVKFITILGADFKSEAERYDDLSTLLWKADFKNITYSCTKGFREVTTEEEADGEIHYGTGEDDERRERRPASPYARQIFSRVPGLKAKIAAGGGGGTGGLGVAGDPGSPEEANFLQALIALDKSGPAAGDSIGMEGAAAGGGGRAGARTQDISDGEAGGGGAGEGGGGEQGGPGGPGGLGWGGGGGGGGGGGKGGGGGWGEEGGGEGAGPGGGGGIPGLAGDPGQAVPPDYVEGDSAFDIRVAEEGGGGGGRGEGVDDPTAPPLTYNNIRKFVQLLDTSEEADETVTPALEEFRKVIAEEMNENSYRYGVFDIVQSLLIAFEQYTQEEIRVVVPSVSKMLSMAVQNGDIPLYFAIVDQLYLLLDPEKEVDPALRQSVVALLAAEVQGERFKNLFFVVLPDNESHLVKLSSFMSAFGRSLSEEVLSLVESLGDEELLIKAEDILLKQNAGKVDFFTEKIYDRRVPVVKTVLKCLARLGTDEAIRAMTRAVRHPSPEVKLFLLRLMKIRGGAFYKAVLMEGMSDRSEDVRLESLRQVMYLRDPVFRNALTKKIEDPGFIALTQIEKSTIAKSLAGIAGKGVEPLFTKLALEHRLRNRDKYNGVKMAAVEALAMIGGDDARKAVARAGRTGFEPLRELCENLLRTMR